MKIIFAQGNPGTDYELSRHNVGFMIVDTLATKLETQWTNKPKFHAQIANGTIGNEKVILVKPTTFYNETGTSARKIIDFYKLNPITDLLVIHDDLALPFGTIREYIRGRDAGNNGIKSINTHIETDYTRIRIGIWNEFRDAMDDSDFVIAKFRNAESRQLKKSVIPQVLELIEKFCDK